VIICALRSQRRRFGMIQNGKQQGGQNRDDGDDHQQFNKRKSAPA
jgi:hypothetical protein